MHSGVIAKRSIEASEKLFSAAEQISKDLGMDEEYESLVSFEDQPRANRDPDLYEMYRLEAVADFMESLSNKIGEFFELNESTDPLYERILTVLDDKQVDNLANAGYDSGESIVNASDEGLLVVEGIGPATLKKIREAVAEFQK